MLTYQLPSVLIESVDPSTASPFLVEAIPWEAKRPNGRVVLIIPPTDGLTICDRYLMWRLQRRGFNGIALKHFTGAWERSLDLEMHQRGLDRAVHAIDLLTKYAGKRWNADQVSMVGASLGGIFAGAAAKEAKNVDRLVLIAAGAPIYKIAAESLLPSVKKIAYLRRRERKLDHDGYEALLKKHIPADERCLTSAPHRKDLLFTATDDSIVPTRWQEHLARQLDTCRQIRIRGGHLKTILLAQTTFAEQICDHLT